MRTIVVFIALVTTAVTQPILSAERSPLGSLGMGTNSSPEAVVAASAQGAKTANDARQGQEDDIREAVFRWQFDHNVSGQQKKAKVYFLAVGEKYSDPSDEFIKRFANNKPPVREKV